VNRLRALAATFSALFASSEALLQLSAFCLTVRDSSSIPEAVSSSVEACCSVRRDRSEFASAISLAECATALALVRTLATIPPRLLFTVPSSFMTLEKDHPAPRPFPP
jgi:hypothetical protein